MVAPAAAAITRSASSSSPPRSPTEAEAEAAAKQLIAETGSPITVVKAQIHAGGLRYPNPIGLPPLP